MLKTCSCGETMDVQLRTVIYSGTVEIANVPVYTCEACVRSEVMPDVKPELTGLIGKLGGKPDKQRIDFEECHELSRLIRMAQDKAHSHVSLEGIVDKRINELLDLLLLAGKLGDAAWTEEIRKRLAQISKSAVH